MWIDHSSYHVLYTLLKSSDSGFIPRPYRTRDKLVVMLLIVVLNVVLGTFMDAIPAILIFVPILHPQGSKLASTRCILASSWL